jgi:NOL1/NOP2/fmu family ribosome biogenesis protein
MKIIYSTEKKKILAQINEQYGISELPYLLLRFGEDKIRIYSGSLSNDELNTLAANLNIENIGLYFAKQEKDGIRLTLDGIQVLKEQITKNILELTDKQADDWLRGNDLDIKTDRGFKILKNSNEFLGCGKSTGERIANFMPKERRIKG